MILLFPIIKSSLLNLFYKGKGLGTCYNTLLAQL